MARKKRYVVAPGKSIMVRGPAGNRLLKPGAIVDESARGFKDHLASGHVIRKGVDEDEDEPEVLKPDFNEKGEIQTGRATEFLTTVEGDGDDSDEGEGDEELPESVGKLVDAPKTPKPPKAPKAPKAEAPIQQQKKWDVDPKTLEKKPLSELNVMVRERDEAIKPFTDRDAAIKQLSADYSKG